MRVRLEPDLDRVARDLAALAELRDPDAPGWTRRAFSPIERESRAWVAATMARAGLAVEADAAGNIIGTLPGTAGLDGAVVTGSHTDTVQGGGRFDGIVGVLGAVEAVRLLAENGIPHRHDLVVVDFYGEEANDFGLSCVGSRAIAGNLDAGHLRLAGPGGTLAEALSLAGGEPGEIAAAAWRPTRVHAFVELHIEQGPRLEAAGVPIGVVTGIAGIHRLLARFAGQPDHAGTTPMALRRDALLGAAETALALERLADRGVATAGRLESRPGAPNVVPSGADLWAEARSDDERWLDGFGRRIEEETSAIAARRRLEWSLEWTSRESPVPVTGSVADAIAAAARSLGIEPLELPSGAGHDAAQMARLGPMGMIFVPSRGGRSHCPEEWTDEEEVGRGIAVLAEVLRSLDSGPPPAAVREGEAVPGDSLPRMSSLLGDEHR